MEDKTVNVTAILPVLQTILAFCNITIIGYGLYKFLNKPHDSLEEKHNELVKRVDKQDHRLDEIEDSLKQGNDTFRAQEETNATFKSVMLSFVNFEIAYCLQTNYPHTEELKDAKEELERYLTGNKHEKKNRH